MFITSLGWQKPFNTYSSLFGLFYVESNILIKCLLSPEIHWCIKLIGQFCLKVSHWVTQNLYQLFILICDEMIYTVFSSVIQHKPPQMHTLHVVNNIYTSYTHNYIQHALYFCFLCFIQWFFWRRKLLGRLGRKMKCCCFILFFWSFVIWQ